MAITAAPTLSQLWDTLKAYAVSLRPDLTFGVGDISEMMAFGAVAPVDRLVGWFSDRLRATFLDGASGEDLTNLCDDHFGVARSAGAKSTATVRFTRSGGTVGTIAAGFRIATVRDVAGNEVRFTVDADMGFLGGDVFKDIACTCEITGTAGNAAIGSITRLLDVAFDTTMTCSNAAVAVGGADEETDDALRARTRANNATLRRGTLYALETGARNVAGVASVTVHEGSTGLATIYVGDASGTGDATMVANVVTELRSWAAAGSAWSVVAGIPQIATVALTLNLKAGVDVASLTTRIKQAVKSAIDKLPAWPGSGSEGKLYRSYVVAAVRNVSPDDVVEVTVLLDGAAVDLTPTAGRFIRTTESNVSVV